MDALLSFLTLGADKLRPYLDQVSLAIVATILAIYGDFFNKKIKHLIKNKPFFVRYSSFILICTFGYGLLTLYFANFLTYFLRQVPGQYLLISVVACFAALGILADQKNQI